MLRRRSAVSACVGEDLLAPQADPLDQPQHERVGAAVLERAAGRAVELQEGGCALAALGRELGPLERPRDRRGHVELAPAGELSQARDVHRAQLDRRARERAHDRARVVRVRQQPQPGEHVAHLGALEVGGGPGGPERQRPLLERGGDHPALVLHRPHEHADLRRLDSLLHDQPLALRPHGLGLGALGAATPEAHAAALGARSASSRCAPPAAAPRQAPRRGCAARSGSCAPAGPRSSPAAPARTRAGSSGTRP